MTHAAPRFRLDGKRILVTGASLGIGRAIALAAAASGSIVVGMPMADCAGHRVIIQI